MNEMHSSHLLELRDILSAFTRKPHRAALRAYFCYPSQASSPDCISSAGFFTAKGNLVSSILYPQPTNFRFYQDSAKFLLLLGVFGKSFSRDLTNFVRVYEEANVICIYS